MKAQWAVNLSMNTPTTLSVLVPAYNEQYLVYASLERLKISRSRRFGSIELSLSMTARPTRPLLSSVSSSAP